MSSFDDILSKHINNTSINTGDNIEKTISDDNSSDENSDEEVTMTDEELTYFKANVDEYCILMTNIEQVQSKIKDYRTELTTLTAEKTKKHKYLLPFMRKKKIDLLETPNYNLEVKYNSKLQTQSKPFILKCLQEFLNNDESYERFINYMQENRTRTKISNLTASKPKK